MDSNILFLLFLPLIRETTAVGYDLYFREVGPKNWCYTDDACKPSTWAHNCQKGQQSPVNLPGNLSALLDTSEAINNFPRELHKLNSLMIYWSGVTISGKHENGDKLKVNYDGQTLFFHSMHMHYGGSNDCGSEHTLDGKSYPAEIHLVYYESSYRQIERALNAENSSAIVVIAVFVEIGLDNYDTNILEEFVGVFSSIDYSSAVDTSRSTNGGNSITLNELFKGNPALAYSYKGSFTTPPCSAITWIVLRTPVLMAEKHIESFRKFYSDWPDMPGRYTPNNFRPLQKKLTDDLKLVKITFD